MMNTKRWIVFASLLMATFLMMGWGDLLAQSAAGAEDPGVYGTWISLMPPIVAIGLALITREVILSLFAGIWIGALFLVGLNPIAGTTQSLSLLTDALVNADHVAIVVFSLFLGGMVGVMSRSGGTQGVVDVLGKFATNRKKARYLRGHRL